MKCGSFYREITTKNDFGNTEITNMGKMQKLHNHTRPIKYYMCIIGFCGVTNENQYISQNVFPLSYMIQLFFFNILDRTFLRYHIYTLCNCLVYMHNTRNKLINGNKWIAGILPDHYFSYELHPQNVLYVNDFRSSAS